MTEDCKECGWNNNGNCLAHPDMCAEIDDCEHKQLKCLEQERDELKFENDRYKQLLKGCPTEDEDCGLCVIDEQNKRLKQENERLKDKADHFEMANDIKKQDIDSLRNTNEQLRSALEEIREIVTSAFAKQRPYKEDFAEIETKINEVLNL